MPLLIAFGVVVAVYIDESFIEQPPPERAPVPPAAAVRLVGVDSFGFYSAVVVIEAADGAIYYYQWDVGWDVWSADATGSEYEEGRKCGQKALNTLTAAAGPLAECLAGQVWGEWCPGPIASYALAADGSLWIHWQPQACYRLLTPSLCVCLPLGALASAALWLFVREVLRIGDGGAGEQGSRSAIRSQPSPQLSPTGRGSITRHS